MTTPNTPEVTDTVRRCVTAWETTRPEHRTLADAEELMQALRDALPTPPTTPKENPKMTDPTIPADVIRAWRDKYRGCTGNNALEALDALIPAPPRPTLADMTADERAASRRMQCDYKGITRNTTSRGVIGYFDHEEKKAVILTDTNGIVRRNYDRVTPRPDLPRLTWPGDTPAPALALPEGWKLADHEKYGRVVVTSPTPDIDGHVYFVAPADSLIGNDWHLCRNDELAYLDNER